jgi:hypothetical protein
VFEWGDPFRLDAPAVKDDICTIPKKLDRSQELARQAVDW